MPQIWPVGGPNVCFHMSHHSDHFQVMFQAHLVFLLLSPRIGYCSKGPWLLLMEAVLESTILVLIPTGMPLSLGFFPPVDIEYIGIYIGPKNIGNNHNGPFCSDSEN